MLDRSIMKSYLRNIEPLLPFWVISPLIARRMTAVFGHYVSDQASPFTKHLYRSPSVSEFRDGLRWMKQRFRFLSLAELTEIQEKGEGFPAKSAFLSFDDGHREMLDVVAPILQEENVPATFFLISSCIDNRFLIYGHRKSFLIEHLEQQTDLPQEVLQELVAFLGLPESAGREALDRKLAHLATKTLEDKAAIDGVMSLLGLDTDRILSEYQPYLTRTQCAQLKTAGFDLGAHSIDHTKFMHLPEEDWEWQLRESVEVVRSNFGQEPVPFSFPNSAKGVGAEWMARMAHDMPELGLFFGTARYRPGSRYLVNRITIDRPLQRRGAFSAKAALTRAFLQSL